MKDFFEPKINLNEYYFEDESNLVGAIIQGTGLAVKGASKVVNYKTKKEIAKSDEVKFIDTICGSKTKFISNKKKQENVKCRQDALSIYKKEKEKELINKEKQISLDKNIISTDKSSLKTNEDEKLKNKNNLILGLSIGGGILVLGTILFFVLRKK